jgi:hypothetical protein
VDIVGGDFNGGHGRYFNRNECRGSHVGWVSGFSRNPTSNTKAKGNFAGGCPAASYFLLLRQNKVAKEKATPVCGYGIT